MCVTDIESDSDDEADFEDDGKVTPKLDDAHRRL